MIDSASKHAAILAGLSDPVPTEDPAAANYVRARDAMVIELAVREAIRLHNTALPDRIVRIVKERIEHGD